MLNNKTMTEQELKAALAHTYGKRMAAELAAEYAVRAERCNYIARYSTLADCKRCNCMDEFRDILLTATHGDIEGVDDYITGRPTRAVTDVMRDEATRGYTIDAVYNMLVSHGCHKYRAEAAALYTAMYTNPDIR